MIKRIAIRKDWTISMSEFRKFAEKYQWEINELEEENKKLNIKVASLEWEIKWLNYAIEKLKEENQYREDIADVLPEWEGHIAEETIQDLQDRIKELNEENETLKEELISRIRQPKNVPYWKWVAELMEEDTLQELKDIGEI